MPLPTRLAVAALLFASVAAAQDVDLGGVTEKHEMVPMRDGTKLSAYLYFPPGQGPVAGAARAALRRPPRRRHAQGRSPSSPRPGTSSPRQNFRGTHKSEGTWVGYRALGWGEQKDGYDTVEWLAKQPWCTGKVGTFGGSQAGFAQNFLAVTQPPHLKAAST